MPKTTIIRCANCNKAQEDQGKGATCYKCGCSPLPSYAYPPDSAFYPSRLITQQQRIEQAVQARKCLSKGSKSKIGGKLP